MSRYTIALSPGFKRQYRKITSGGRYQKSDFQKVYDLLAAGELLPEQYLDHPLKDREPERELHIRPDWLLIYKYVDEQTVRLIATGSHSDLFE